MHRRRVVQRHRHERLVVDIEIERQDAADVLVNEGGVGHHRALGAGRGARRVEELGQAGAGGGGVESPGAFGGQRGTEDCAIGGLACRGLERECGEAGHPAENGIERRRLRRVDQHDRCTRISEQVLELAAG